MENLYTIEKHNLQKHINNVTEWVITCNPSYYDVNCAFNIFKKIEWKQSVNINAGDIVYIYVGKPFKEIKYKCIAKKLI